MYEIFNAHAILSVDECFFCNVSVEFFQFKIKPSEPLNHSSWKCLFKTWGNYFQKRDINSEKIDLLYIFI